MRSCLAYFVIALSACAEDADVVARRLEHPKEEEPPVSTGGSPRGEGGSAPGEPPLLEEPRDPRLLELRGELQGTDPAIIASPVGYHLFHTGAGISTKFSADLHHFEVGPPVFEENPAWIAAAIPDATLLWAPAISHFGGRYHLYYSVSTFGSSRSCIGHATALSLGGPDAPTEWFDQGPVLCSNVDDPADYNAIDPDVRVTSQGEIWLVFGSFASGIHLTELDEEGAQKGTTVLPVATRSASNNAIQGPVLVEHERHFYLITSMDRCCIGIDSTRWLAVGRAETITGPYIDRQGLPLLEGGGSVLLSGDERFRGPGAAAWLAGDAFDYLVYDAYDVEANGQSCLRISEVGWDSEGWPFTVGP